MAINLVRFELDGIPRWGVVAESGVSPLAGDYPTTAALIDHGQPDWLAAKARAASLSLDSVKILSPVTAPCRIYRQARVRAGLVTEVRRTGGSNACRPFAGPIRLPPEAALLLETSPLLAELARCFAACVLAV